MIPKEESKTPQSPEVAEPRASAVDWLGAFLFTAGALLLLLSLSEGVSDGWNKPFVIVLLIVSVLLLIAFVLWEHRLEKLNKEPLLPVSIFNNGRFSCAMAVVFIFSAAFTNLLIYTTYLYVIILTAITRLMLPLAGKIINCSPRFKPRFVTFHWVLWEV